MKNTLGVAIIARNAETTIGASLRSIEFVDSIIVVDSGSIDKTREISTLHGAKLIEKEWLGYGRQKEFAISELKTDWILVLDSDEYLSPEGKKELIEIINSDESLDGYKIPIAQIFMGKILRYGRGVDCNMRLFKNGKGHFTESNIHEQLIIDGETGEMINGLIHQSAMTINERLMKIYRDVELELQYYDGRIISFSNIYIDPLRYFLSNIMKRKMWRDGISGVVLAALFAYQMFLQNSNFKRLYENN